jgi:hypothetical protein
MPSENRIVAVTYCDDGKGLRRLSYAADLAALTRSALQIVLPLSAAEQDIAGTESALSAIDFRLGDQVRPPGTLTAGSAGDAGKGIRKLIESGAKIIAVVSDEDPLYAELPCIVSKDEERVFRNGGKKEILLPFGPGNAGIRVLETIRPLAVSLGAGIRLYHTTWRDEKVSSENARDHMCATALEALARLQALGPFEATLEMVAEVDAGIHLAALKNGSSLIAMTRGRRVVKGGYVSELIARSAVPVIIIP